jgi:hypothetical protein
MKQKHGFVKGINKFVKFIKFVKESRHQTFDIVFFIFYFVSSGNRQFLVDRKNKKGSTTFK